MLFRSNDDLSNQILNLILAKKGAKWRVQNVKGKGTIAIDA